MAKWRVFGTVVGGKYLGEVEAATKEEAEQKAEQLDNYVGLCHHCSGECENAEITEINVEEVPNANRD